MMARRQIRLSLDEELKEPLPNDDTIYVHLFVEVTPHGIIEERAHAKSKVPFFYVYRKGEKVETENKKVLEQVLSLASLKRLAGINDAEVDYFRALYQAVHAYSKLRETS